MSELYSDYFLARRLSAAAQTSAHIPPVLTNRLPTDKTANILDIGCGTGCILRGLRGAGYTNIFGVDVSPEAAAICQKDGLDVTCTHDLSAFAATGGRRYEFVLLTHVIEHIKKSEVISFLRTIRTSILSRTGNLYIATPNAQSPTGAYWAYEDFTHELLYTTGSLYFVLYQAGFRSITFLDPYGLIGRRRLKRPLLWAQARVAHWLYKRWLAATGSATHPASPVVLTWELKVLAT